MSRRPNFGGMGGMNNIGGLDNLLVILNDNKMSISKNVGALARYLTHLRTTTAYYDAKDNVRSFLDGVPVIGTPMKKSLIGAKTLVRLLPRRATKSITESPSAFIRMLSCFRVWQ